MPDSVFYQICSAALYVATAAMLTYVSIGRPNLAKRVVAVSAIATCAMAIVLMMRSYAGEKEIVLERAGPIERRQIARERGYFEFVDKPGADTSSSGGTSRAAGRSSHAAQDDGATEAGRGPLRGMVTRLASAAGGLFGSEFQQEAPACPECPEMVLIEPGYFVMGAPLEDREASAFEKPASVKRIGRRFAIARTETTMAQYMMFARATGRGAPGCLQASASSKADPELPVTCVSWSDAVAHAAWLTARTGKTYRLPSEAEWEFAARAGSAQPDGPGRSTQSAPAAAALDGGTARRVGSLPPNAFGLHDIGGNVAELAADCWRDSPSALPGDGSPAARGSCDWRALRDVSALERHGPDRVTSRRPIGIDAPLQGVGYRLARDL